MMMKKKEEGRKPLQVRCKREREKERELRERGSTFQIRSVRCFLYSYDYIILLGVDKNGVDTIMMMIIILCNNYNIMYLVYDDDIRGRINKVRAAAAANEEAEEADDTQWRRSDFS